MWSSKTGFSVCVLFTVFWKHLYTKEKKIQNALNDYTLIRIGSPCPSSLMTSHFGPLSCFQNLDQLQTSRNRFIQVSHAEFLDILSVLWCNGLKSNKCEFQSWHRFCVTFKVISGSFDVIICEMGIIKYSKWLGYVRQYAKYQDSTWHTSAYKVFSTWLLLNQVWNMMGYNDIIMMIFSSSFLFYQGIQ